VLSWWLCYLIYVQLWGKRYSLVSFCVGRRDYLMGLSVLKKHGML